MGRFLRRVVLGLFAALAVARAAGFLAYVAWEIGSPLEVYNLEAQMVGLSRRVQEGRTLYPAWRDDPHVANFFSPGYFVAVGGLGALAGADLDGLFRIGRALTVGSGLLAAVAVGAVIGRRYGRGAGIVGGACALGAVPMHGFGLMARPDVAADLLGFAGFLLAVGGSRARQASGAALLVLAALTKQTAGMYLLAAALARVAAGRSRSAGTLLAGGALALGAIVAAGTVSWEPRLAADLLGEAATPIDPENWRVVMGRVLVLSPDLLILSAAGLACWCRGRTRDPTLAALAVVLAVSCLATLVKMGSDLNYLLPLRLVAALAAGTLWGAAAPRAHPGWTAAVLLGALALWPGVVQAHHYADRARRQALFRASGEGRDALRSYRRLLRRAEDPAGLLLTNYGLLALHQGDRAPFVDPWLFRMLVQTGRIRPDRIRARLRDQEYDLLVLMTPLETAPDEYYTFDLPPVLAAEALRNYTTAGTLGDLFLYIPRRPAGERRRTGD